MGVGDGEKVEDRQKVQVKVLQKRRFHQHQKNCTTGGRDSQNLEEQRIQVVQEEVQVVGDEEEGWGTRWRRGRKSRGDSSNTRKSLQQKEETAKFARKVKMRQICWGDVFFGEIKHLIKTMIRNKQIINK